MKAEVRALTKLKEENDLLKANKTASKNKAIVVADSSKVIYSAPLARLDSEYSTRIVPNLKSIDLSNTSKYKSDHEVLKPGEYTVTALGRKTHYRVERYFAILKDRYGTLNYVFCSPNLERLISKKKEDGVMFDVYIGDTYRSRENSNNKDLVVREMTQYV